MAWENSTVRTEQQTVITRVRISGIGALWNPVVRQVSEQKSDGLIENARLSAVLNVAFAHVQMVGHDMKCRHALRRPVMAICRGNQGDNDSMISDASWERMRSTILFV
jgi:hypothetical protein